MNETNIVLIGFMAAGKSTVAQKLAELCKRPVISTDKLIEQREKSTIAHIFATKGEMYFRAAEARAVEVVSKKKNAIIDCGGGVVLNSKNIAALKKNGRLFYLAASVDVISKRAKNNKERPLLNVADQKETITSLLAKRQPLYNQANHMIDTDTKTIEQICKEIVRVMDEK